MKEPCEFCSELQGTTSRFHKYYRGFLSTRVLIETPQLVVMPSMGQIVPGSLMVLTRFHVERFADLDDQGMREAEAVFTTIMSTSTSTIVFEHGARESTGGSCGIYHAHVHIVELPAGIEAAQLASDLAPDRRTLPDCWANLGTSDEYLLLRDSTGETWTRRIERQERAYFPSQYFRRLLAKASGHSDRWNWRDTSQPEPELIDTFQIWTTRFGALAATSSC